MSYAKLYAHCQSLPVHIGRNLVREAVLELAGRTGGRQVRMALDPAICRGLYLSARNTESVLVKQFGGCIIATARGLDPLMDRFIYVKELMHMFDDPEEAVDSGEKLEALLDEFSDTASKSIHMLAEFGCFWMALGALCPEDCRKMLEADRVSGKIDEDGISTKLKIPLQYVPRLFEGRYPELIETLVEGRRLG